MVDGAEADPDLANNTASAVTIVDGVAYVASGNSVSMVDLVTGNVLGQESFSGGPVNALSVDRGNLYVLSSAGFSSRFKLASATKVAPSVTMRWSCAEDGCQHCTLSDKELNAALLCAVSVPVRFSP